jgi:DNA mismatch repair protein MutL
MYLIDKHAAHERIIYEKIKHASDNNEAQFLIEPFTLPLTPKEFEAARQNVAYFKKTGFDFEEFGSDTVLIRSMPSILDVSDVKDVFTFLAGSLAEGNSKSAGEIFDRALFTAACKAAIKGGNKNTEIDNVFIINEIFTNDAVLYCPHGRPVIYELSRSKLEKIFGR